MIVKVQVSIVTSNQKQQVLIYNRDQSVMGEFDANDMVKHVMGNSIKKYFKAHTKKDKLILGDEVDKQNW
jgi:hypothetical protein